MYRRPFTRLARTICGGKSNRRSIRIVNCACNALRCIHLCFCQEFPTTMIPCPANPRRSMLRSIGLALLACLSFSPAFLLAQEYAPTTLPEMHWRMIGPFRGDARARTVFEPAECIYVGRGMAGYGRATTMGGHGFRSSMANHRSRSAP